MSIADKITSIETHLQADYEGLENIGGDITGINKNILNIRTILDTIYNDMPKVTGEGTEVTLTPTRKGRLALIPKGNSTQESTNGYNLLTLNSLSSLSGTTSLGVTRTINNSILKLNGTTSGAGAIISEQQSINIKLNAGTYTFSIRILSGSVTRTTQNIAIIFYDTNGDSLCQRNLSDILNNNNSVQFTLSEEKTINNLYIYANNSGVVFDNCELGMQIESGSTMHDFEQFTNGASPNPSYPQTIKSVTGNNNVVVSNKNKLKVINNESGDLNGISWVKNSDNSFTLNGTADGNFTLVVSDTNWQNEIANGKTYTISGCPSGGSDNTYRIQAFNFNGTSVPTDTGNGVTSVANLSSGSNIAIRVFSGVSVNNLTFKPMIEEGSTATSYVEHKEQTKPLNLGNTELNKIGTYQDYIYKNNGKWYKKENIGKTKLLSSMCTSVTASASYGTLCYLNFVGKVANSSVCAMSNKFVGVSYDNRTSIPTGYRIFTSDGSGAVTIRFPNTSDIDTLQEVKDFVDNNGDIYIYYVLANANDIEITDTTLISQLEEINKMKSYEGTTIITSTFDSNNAQMIISASGLKGE